MTSIRSCSKRGGIFAHWPKVGALACVAGVLGVAQAYAADPRIDVYVANGRGGTVQAAPERLTSLARVSGPVPLIVRLPTGFEPEGDLSSFQAANQRVAIENAQSRVLSRIAGPRNVWRYESVPMVAMTVGTGDIETLLDDPNVETIYQDVPVPLALNKSVPLIRANKLWTKRGVKGGKGWVVAVLDTGVQINHPALKGKVVSGACYSTGGLYGSKSFCPGGVASAKTKRSATYCPLSVDGCEHGTHVAGIAVGNPPNKYKGVARKASLIPIQVFVEFDDEDICDDPDPCTLSLTSDQLKGFERVNELTRKFKIASVNMSIGGDPTSRRCNNDVLAPIIETLRSKKVAVVIAAGNEFEDGKVSEPGCISAAITVGSTTLDDEVSVFSNFDNKLVDMMAPGSDIVSSVPVNGYEMLSGTSMAAPHVAGAWALLRSAAPDASVAKIRKALRRTGVKVTRNGIANKRIDVWAAYKKLKKSRGRN